MNDEIRTNAQNRKFHAMVADISKQLQWAGAFMDEEDWKRLFLAGAHGQKAVPNPFDPHKPFIVINNSRSRDLLIPSMAELILQIEIFGDERGVIWDGVEVAA